MRIESDWRALLELSARPESYAGNEDIIYRACCAAASVGRTLPEESKLGLLQRRIQEARRLLFQGRFAEVRSLLEGEAWNEASLLLQGDRFCLLALVAHRCDRNWGAARQGMNDGALLFERAGEYHRMLRARINALICARDLGEYDQGALYSLERECVRRGYYDQSGAIQRGRAIELLNAGEFSRAAIEGARAVESYHLDGCPEDRAVGEAVHAIAVALCGRIEEARRLESEISVRKGRAESYLAVLAQLFAGRVPALDSSHPLSRVPWKRSSSHLIRRGSTYGRVLELLKARPYPRHELIEAVWGTGVGGASYDNRLYVAINTLRKKYGISVQFDGERYSV